MTKRIQNRVAESRNTLPVMLIYGLLVWIASGVLQPFYPLESHGLTNFAWIQLLCFLLSAVLIMVMNNRYALIRIYSRSVSCAFILLSCMACFQFNSLAGGIISLCTVSLFVLLFQTFQDKESQGWVFYAFFCLGLASLIFIPILVYLPLMWLLMIFQLNSAGWRTIAASVIGVLTPYWLAGGVLVAMGNIELITEHFARMTDWQLTGDYRQLTINQMATLLLIVLFAVTGIIHYWRNKHADKIRTRVMYNCFIYTTLFTLALIAAAPVYYDELTHILIICVSPLVGHFVALTHTRLTNIAFIAGTAVTLLLTALNLWMPSLTF